MLIFQETNGFVYDYLNGEFFVVYPYIFVSFKAVNRFHHKQKSFSEVKYHLINEQYTKYIDFT